MRRDLVPTAAGNALDRIFECRVLERLDLPAVVAYEVVVMLAAGVGVLEARDPVAQIHALCEAELVQAFERAVDARDADARTLRAHGVVDLLCRQAAALAPEELDDDAPCSTAPPARCPKARQRGLCPLFHRR